MNRISQKDIDWLLNLKNGSSDSGYSHSSSRIKNKWSRLLFWFLIIVILGIIPFFLLVRVSVLLNLSYNWNGWTALGGGVAATIVFLLIYIALIIRKTANKKQLLKYSLGGISALVLAFCIYGLVFQSSVNSKNYEIQQVYHSLHPILRVAVVTMTLADNDLLITDIQRQPDDYYRMKLPVNHGSLHIPQSTGYVHAIDLRTIGRGKIRNFILRSAFQILGFTTIRHVGTADHLHVSLPLPD